jgi:2'-5' RNA ligase
MPTQTSRTNAILKDRINELVRQHPPAPTFDPHITLMPTKPLSEDLTELQRALQTALKSWNDANKRSGSGPLRLKLQPPQAGDIFFQAIISPVDVTSASSVGLLDLRRRAEDALDVHPPSYFPHLSLMYSAKDKSELERIVRDVNQEHVGEGLPSEVEVDEVWIVKATGEVDTWQPVTRLSLDGNVL